MNGRIFLCIPSRVQVQVTLHRSTCAGTPRVVASRYAIDMDNRGPIEERITLQCLGCSEDVATIRKPFPYTPYCRIP